MQNSRGISSVAIAAIFCLLTMGISAPHTLAEITIDGSGWSDPAVGTFVDNVATLTTDVNEMIVIAADGITLDGAGHVIEYVDPSSGVVGVRIDTVYAPTGIIVKNLQIRNFSNGIFVDNSDNITIEDNTLTDCHFGIWIQRSDHDTLSGNEILDCWYNGIYLSTGSDFATITKNTLSGCGDSALWISGSSDAEIHLNAFEANDYYAVAIYSGDRNLVHSNNFIGNCLVGTGKRQARQYSGAGSANLFTLVGVGGNYWSDYLDWYPGAVEAGGFWDTPYAVQDFLNQDDQPLVDPVDLSGSQNPPAVTITSPVDGFVTNGGTVTVAATIAGEAEMTVTSEPGDLVEILNAPGGTVSAEVPLDDEGDNWIFITAVYATGEPETETVNVIRDTIAPVVTVLTPSNDAIFGESQITLAVAVEDATDCVLTFGSHTNTVAPGGQPVTGAVDLVEGGNLFEITATDAAGNVTSITHNLILDLSAPIVVIDTPADGDAFGPGEDMISVVASVDDLSVTLIESVPTGVTGVLPPGGGFVTGSVQLIEGWNTITVKAEDEFSDQGSDAITVTLDTTPPAISIVMPEEQETVSAMVDFEADVDDGSQGTGIASVQFLVDDVEVDVLYAAPFGIDYDTQVAGLDDGPHTFSVIAVDNLGNGSETSVTVVVDNSGPQIRFDAPLDGDYLSGVMDIEVTAWNDLSDVAEIKVEVAGAAPSDDPSATFDPPLASATVSGSEDTTIHPDGYLTLKATAWDAEGNETIVEVTVLVDNTASELLITNPLDGKKVSGIVPITVETPSTDFEWIEILVDGVSLGTSSASPFTVAYDTTTRLDGKMEITARVKDLGGIITEGSITVKVDNISLRLYPRSLTLFKGHLLRFCRAPVKAKLEGAGVDLMIPYESHAIELHVPGGSPVAATGAWSQSYDCDNDGLPEWRVTFDRRELTNSIRAGIQSGVIPTPRGCRPVKVKVSFVADGKVIGTVRMKVRDPFHW